MYCFQTKLTISNYTLMLTLQTLSRVRQLDIKMLGKGY